MPNRLLTPKKASSAASTMDYAAIVELTTRHKHCILSQSLCSRPAPASTMHSSRLRHQTCLQRSSNIFKTSQQHATRPQRHTNCTLPVVCSAAVGIDLGTTNSVVAILRKGETCPQVIQEPSGSFTIPSVVSYTSSGNILVGQPAKQQALVNPLNTFYSVKRLIGKQFDQLQGLGLVYDISADEQGGVQLECPAQGSTLRPQQVTRLLPLCLFTCEKYQHLALDAGSALISAA